MTSEPKEANVVVYEVKDGIAIITINDPANRNALSRPVRDGLWESFRTFQEDKGALVAILRGEGPDAFCAGADLKRLGTWEEGDPAEFDVRRYTPMPGRNLIVDKPWIAAVHGWALGGGVLYTMLADLAIAAENAKFGLPEVRLGRGAPWSVPMLYQVPRKVWFELAVTGRQIDAQRAYEIGFVNTVVPSERLFEEAMSWAQELRDGAPLTMAATVKMSRMAPDMGQVNAWDLANELFHPVYMSEDAREGPRAWAERRTPEWKGR